MKKQVYSTFLVVLLIFVSCTESKKQKEITNIPMEFKVIRFDSLFFNTPTAELLKLKNDFPYFFPETVPDLEWENKQTMPIQKELYAEVKKTFGNFSREKKALKSVFQHIKYHYPKFIPPKVVTVTSDVDYNYRAIYADSLLVLGLDNYLGENHRFYQSFPVYTRFELDKKFLPIDVALVFSEKVIPKQRIQTFLDVMIFEGKKIFLASQLLEGVSEKDLLKYSEKKYQWATENESNIWRYFIDSELLYGTDHKTLQRFVEPAPFSKFYLEHDQESPGGIGKFIGLKIVQAYFKKYPKKISEIVKIPSENIFKQSNYKPNKSVF